MDKYQLLNKQTHYPTTREAISVAEYMQIKDQETDDIFLIISLNNHTNMMILQATFEIIQLDPKEHPIQRAKYVFNDLKCPAFSTTIPLEKIKLHKNGVHIQAKLIHTESPDRVWTNGVWVDKENVEKKVTSKPYFHKIPISHKPYKYPLYVPIGLFVFFIAVVYVLYWFLQVYEPIS